MQFIISLGQQLIMDVYGDQGFIETVFETGTVNSQNALEGFIEAEHAAGITHVEVRSSSSGFNCAIDDLRVSSECPADLDGSGAVDIGDLLAILAAWGNKGGPEDLDGNGVVDIGDLLIVLSSWGPCE